MDPVSNFYHNNIARYLPSSCGKHLKTHENVQNDANSLSSATSAPISEYEATTPGVIANRKKSELKTSSRIYTIAYICTKELKFPTDITDMVMLYDDPTPEFIERAKGNIFLKATDFVIAKLFKKNKFFYDARKILPQISSLSLDFEKNPIGFFGQLKIPAMFTKIETLQIENLKSLDIDIIKRFKHLKSLDLKNVDISDNDLVSLAKDAKSIDSINLYNCRKITTQGIRDAEKVKPSLTITKIA